jgi:hypothetical protein
VAAVTFFSAGSGCGGGGSGGAGGTGGGGGGSGALLYRPCTDATRVGGFTVRLLPEQAVTSFAGGVREGVLPSNVWQQIATAGDCRLVIGPALTCTQGCTSPQICAGQNQCIDEPRFRNVGTASVTGLSSAPVEAMRNEMNNNYNALPSPPYPPPAPGADVTLQVMGADLPGFNLAGRGVPELQLGTASLTVMGGQAFSFTWTPPAQPGAARILASLDIAHHGGIAARIDCDFDDDGSGEMPATLIDQLIARGTAGFPELLLVRRTVDSTTISPGCVDFQVAAEAATEVGVCLSPGNCVISCSVDRPCVTGTCNTTTFKCE